MAWGAAGGCELHTLVLGSTSKTVNSPPVEPKTCYSPCWLEKDIQAKRVSRICDHVKADQESFLFKSNTTFTPNVKLRFLFLDERALITQCRSSLTAVTIKLPLPRDCLMVTLSFR